MLQKTTSQLKVRYKSNKRKDEFARDLIGRVNAYFKENNLSKYANGQMVFKTVLFLVAFAIMYSLIIANVFSGSLWTLLLAFTGLGFINIFIAMNIMHDACHNAYSKDKKTNRQLGYTMNLIGGNSYLFTKMHDAHHAFVNIHGIDVTLESHGLFRFTPHEPYAPKHRWQHIYVSIVYALVSIHWVFVKDFKWFFIEDSIGNEKNINHPRSEMWILLVTKLLYYSYALIIPLVVLNVPFWAVLLGFLCMHIPSSLFFALVFQITHVYNGTHYPLPDERGNIQNNYFMHVLETTADFSRKNDLWTFFMGGINLHVAHHLFPTICHVHYPALTEIIRETAAEYGIQYYENPGFWNAYGKHLKLMHMLSKPDAFVPQYGSSALYN